MPQTQAFVESLVGRLQTLLPSRLGQSVAEIELNPQYLITKRLMLHHAKNYVRKDHEDFVEVPEESELVEHEDAAFISALFVHLTKLLEQINADVGDNRQQLASILLVLKLMSDIIRHVWSNEKPLTVKQVSYNDVGLSTESDSDTSSVSTDSSLKNINTVLYSLAFRNDDFSNKKAPPPLADMDPVLEVLVSLLLTQLNRKVIAQIRRKLVDKYVQPSKSNDANLSSSLTATLLQNVPTPSPADEPATVTAAADLALVDSHELVELIEEIDKNLHLGFLYISHANPGEFYDFLTAKVINYSKMGEFIPVLVLQKYAPLFRYLFLTPDILNSITSSIYNALPFIKSNTWKQALLVYYTRALKDQWFSRCEELNGAVKPYTKVEVTCKNLFDYVSTIFEDFSSPVTLSAVQSMLITFCISDFMDLESKPNKLRIAFNKRLKYIGGILRDASNCANLECFEALINIFHMAAVLPIDLHAHPLYKFSLQHLDETYENLNKLVVNSTEAADTYEHIVQSFFTAAVLLRPHKYIEVLLAKFTDVKENIKEVRILVKIILGLSKLERTTPAFRRLMTHLVVPLKLMIFGAYKVLMAFDSPSSSGMSFQSSDKFSEDSENKRHIGHVQNKKLLFDHYISGEEDLLGKNIKHDISSIVLSTSTKHKLVIYAEEILSDLFALFVAAPDLYYNDDNLMVEEKYDRDPDALIANLTQYLNEVVMPLKFAFQAKNAYENLKLFDTALALALSSVSTNRTVHTNSNYVAVYSRFIISNFIIEAIADACVLFSLTDPKFKSMFLFLTHFLQTRGTYIGKVSDNKILHTDVSHVDCLEVCRAMEKCLLMALCTHDIQFYSLAKLTMSWHIYEIHNGNHLDNCFWENLGPTFAKIIKDETVFTGFVSLHKRIRNFLREATATQSLYYVWIVIYDRWLDMVENRSSLSDESLVFRHFTGFLVSTAGSFLRDDFSKNEPEARERARVLIPDFFDKAISLLVSQDLVLRVIVKDAISNESHSGIYHLICSKLMAVGQEYVDAGQVDEESTLFFEQFIIIVSSMIQVDNDGAFVLVSLLPGVCEFIIKYVMLVPNVADVIRLKLRFCKLASHIESDKPRVGLAGAFKLRNQYAKASAEWLDQAVFFDEHNPDENSVEVAHLNLDLAVECSKALSMQLENIVLEVPEGTKDKDMRKHKDLAFGKYFSLFYKILQKYAGVDLSTTKNKFKISNIIDNVLACISNILQFDHDIGMQFVLPLGYHENKKIRSLFLNVFANMLSSRKQIKEQEEFPDPMIEKLSGLYEIYGASAEVASLAEHNMLALSLFGIFSYTRKLDKLFRVLMFDEISVVLRSTDIFRRNSTLTRLLSNFAKDYGLEYLSVTLKPFIDELVQNEVFFEVEKAGDIENADVFMTYLKKLVDAICDSVDQVPGSFEFICAEIYKCVKVKFEDAALVAVGSFIFLRFFCPAIISPFTFFHVDNISPKVKRLLMQLVKVIQNMANGSLGLLKWPGLQKHTAELNDLNKRIFAFLEKVARPQNSDVYPFQCTDVKPIPELRYLHKFLYTYFIYIKHQYILTDPLVAKTDLHERIERFRSLDGILRELGQPKALISLQISNSFRNFDPNGSVNHAAYNEFMSRLSSKVYDVPSDSPLVNSTLFADGTPVIVMNFANIKYANYDVEYFVFKFLETACQVWDSKFYMVFDFTEFMYFEGLGQRYAHLLQTCTPSILYKNCLRLYYFNIPRSEHMDILRAMKTLRLDNADHLGKVYTYSLVDGPEIINKLCLEDSTTSITRDVRVVYKNVKLLDQRTGRFQRVTLKIGRQWLQVCGDFVEFTGPAIATKGFYPVEVQRLADISKCETSSVSGAADEFTIHLAVPGQKFVLRSHERLEILRYLYFTTSRLPKQLVQDMYRDEESEVSFLWFARLYNIVFQGLLDDDEEVRTNSAYLFASLSVYYDLDFGFARSHAKSIAFPSDSTRFIETVSTYLAQTVGMLSYRFFRAFFDNYERLSSGNKLSAIMYLSPWVDNVCDHIYLDNDETGIEKVSEIIRQFCRITVLSSGQLSFLNKYVWLKLFAEPRLTTILVEEVVAFSIDANDYNSIISIITPTVDVCGEVVTRLIRCVGEASVNDLAAATQSKLLEITVLVKVCAMVFFNLYVFSHLYLADVFFVTTLFIDDPTLDFGADLQILIINTVQAFVHKPHITAHQVEKVEDIIKFFSSQRARMLFGLTGANRLLQVENSQIFNRALTFETLCDQLDGFIDALGNSDDKFRWRLRWTLRSVDVAFQRDSIFHHRAFLVVGMLSRLGINDSTVSRITKMMGRESTTSMSHVINDTVAIARVFDGVLSQSVFPLVFIWPEMCFALMNVEQMYQPVLQCLTNVYCKVLDLGPEYINIIFEKRKLLEPMVTDFETANNVKLEKENFGVYMFFIVSQGLKVPHLRATSLNSLKKIFKKRFDICSEDQKRNLDISNFCLPYLFFVYLNTRPSEFEEFIARTGLVVRKYETVKKNKVPRIIVDFVHGNTQMTKNVLIQTAHFFAHENIETQFKSKFLDLFTVLFKKNRELSYRIYHIIQNTLEELFTTSQDLEVVTSIANIFSQVRSDPNYDAKKYMELETELYALARCDIIKNYKDFRSSNDNDFQAYFDETSLFIRKMVFHASGAFVEGQRLED